MTDLTHAQRDLLGRAAADPDGGIDAPDDAKLIKTLIKQGLIISLPVAGGPSRLLISEAGSAALEASLGGEGTRDVDQTPTAAEPRAVASEPIVEAPAPAAEPPSKAAPGGKLGVLVALLQHPEGATLEAMVAATGWQAHSVRGAMSGSLKKQRGFAITSEKTGAGCVYKIVARGPSDGSGMDGAAFGHDVGPGQEGSWTALPLLRLHRRAAGAQGRSRVAGAVPGAGA
jgi:hypothetical protein